MPLIIKVAVSRKLTEDFNSRGWSLDIQSELDPRTLDDTNTLADSTNYLFQLANDLLDQQVQNGAVSNGTTGNGHNANIQQGAAGQSNHGGRNQNNRFAGNGTYSRQNNGNGQSHDHRNGTAPKGNSGRKERGITSAQINAVNKLAGKFDTNGESIAGEDFGCKLSELTIKQASDLIDRLKKGLESRENQGAGR